MKATLFTLDNVLSNYYPHALTDELVRDGIAHSCGMPYRVSLLNNDGRVLRANPSKDTYETVLIAVCDQCASLHHPTAYNYCRIAFTGTLLSSIRPDLLMKALEMEIRQGYDDLKRYLQGLPPEKWLSVWDRAEMAEKITQMLLAKGSMLLSELADEFKLEDTSFLLIFLEKLGFVRERNWRVPVVQKIEWWKENPLPMLPGEKIDTLIALPPDHPLAQAAYRLT